MIWDPEREREMNIADFYLQDPSNLFAVAKLIETNKLKGEKQVDLIDKRAVYIILYTKLHHFSLSYSSGFDYYYYFNVDVQVDVNANADHHHRSLLCSSSLLCFFILFWSS